MAFQQCFVQGWESIPETGKTSSACFDCSICLDFARDPVVTLCGHLYCWPCIYKWFDSQTTSELPQCPVCKSEISLKTIVPLYGTGKVQSPSESKPEGKAIPPRPPACGMKGLMDLSHPESQVSPRVPHPSPRNVPTPGVNSSLPPPLFDPRGSSPSPLSHPTVGMFGEMVYDRVFGNSQSLYTYPNSYQSVVRSSPRLRRQHSQADTSLNRVTIFLFCFFLLCLVVF